MLVLALMAISTNARCQEAPGPESVPEAAPAPDASQEAEAPAAKDPRTQEEKDAARAAKAAAAASGAAHAPAAPASQAESRPRLEAARAAKAAASAEQVLGGQVPEGQAAAAAKPPAGQDADAQLAAPISTAARAYAVKAREVLALELQVQEFEANSLGLEDPETLHGYRKTRRLRIEQDRTSHAIAGQFSIKPLAMPDPAQAPGTAPAALKFYAALLRAYESTRDTKPLEKMQQFNQSFLKSEDWAARDRAVGIRDELTDRGAMFTTLTHRAWDLRRGTLDEGTIPDLIAMLHEQVPEPAAEASDLAVLVLSNPELRTRVMTEIVGLLAVPLQAAAPLPPAEELTGQVVALQSELLEKADLSKVAEQDTQLGEELDKVNAELIASPSKAALEKKVKIVSRRAELEQQWYTTDPDPETFDALADAQEQLIRRRILDLDTMGALFGARLDGIVGEREDVDDSAWSRWQLLQSQRELLLALEAAKPTATPLDNVVPPPIYGIDLLEKAKAKQAAKSKAIGKPKGLGTFKGKSAPKPKAAPKAAPKPKKKKGSPY